MQSLYQFGKETALELIADYLAREETAQDWHETQAAEEHDIQDAVSDPLYAQMQAHASLLVERAEAVSNGFTTLTPEQLHAEPELLPVFMHSAGVFSVAALRKAVGAISNRMSVKASERIAAYLSAKLGSGAPRDRLVGQLGTTIEGQVRDLLGRYLLETIVEAAFVREKVPFVRESEYTALAGVVYDHRADFLVPNADAPKLFVEVRRSSPRHSSLYAKDKMFSAINWKGRHPDLIGALVFDGGWSQPARRALAEVFDYVLPVSQADELARIAAAYLDGDRSMLRKRIRFEIT